ncbi:hypothetical protein BJY24_001422 [Nocardia transvalensis]|uniref:Uncharacterized protein n=1 Tax=Nocardia transvalensis TaxID=37333 RepID=A0A7W9UHB6_9NOCA|nr:hypothetical protein [Nocardia transvalensis]MBB5912555.1 hypothetical protein [Nocardia transvalensis]
MNVELAGVLRQLEKEKRTGVLRVGDGSFHLVEGVVAAASCHRATGLDQLALAAGAATADDWRRAESGDPAAVLGSPRLEVLALLSVFDAAYFLLAAPTVAKFRPMPPHWLARICQITPGALVHEIERRGDPETGLWPAGWVDRYPIIPVRRVRRRRVVLTASQVEMLSAADTRRTITVIARDLGRTTFACLMAVRDLTAAGLVEPPVLLPGPADDEAAPDHPPNHAPAQAPTTPLRRRVPSMTQVPVQDRWEPVDRDVLIRLRAALEELA